MNFENSCQFRSEGGGNVDFVACGFLSTPPPTQVYEEIPLFRRNKWLAQFARPGKQAVEEKKSDENEREGEKHFHTATMNVSALLNFY